MKKITLGGMQASDIVLGCMRISDMAVSRVQELLETAVEEGINYFDHADLYGHGASEEVFAKAMGQKPSLRERIYLQSKCGIRDDGGLFRYDFSKSHILKSVDGILKRLNTDYLDALLLHRPDPLVEPEEVAEAFELGLRVLDVEGAGEAAFGGQCGDAAGEGGDRACADLADFAECPADLRDEGAGAFLGGFVDGVADVAFDAFAESFAGWFDVDVYDADVLCCHRVPCCVSGFRWRSGSEVVVDVEVGFEPFPVLALPTGEAVRRCRRAERVVLVVEPWAFALSGQHPDRLFGSIGRVDGVLQRHPRVARMVFEDFAGQCPCESPIDSWTLAFNPFPEAYGPVYLPVRSDPVLG